eukprot:scaffold34631_cov251-Amphora_coffeaeformis.AAC.13
MAAKIIVMGVLDGGGATHFTFSEGQTGKKLPYGNQASVCVNETIALSGIYKHAGTKEANESSSSSLARMVGNKRKSLRIPSSPDTQKKER